MTTKVTLFVDPGSVRDTEIRVRENSRDADGNLDPYPPATNAITLVPGVETEFHLHDALELRVYEVPRRR